MVGGSFTKLQRYHDLDSFSKISYAVHTRISDVVNIESELGLICLMNNGSDLYINDKKYKNTHKQNRQFIDGKIKEKLEDIRNSLDSFEDYNRKIVAAMSGMTLYQNLVDKINLKEVNITRSGTAEIFSLNEGTRQLVTTVLSITETPLKSITFENPDVIWFLDNSRGDLMNKMISFTQYISIIEQAVRQQQLEASRATQYAFLFAGAIFLPLFYLSSYCYFRNKERFVDTFYSFEQDKVNKIINKSEKYLQYIQMHQLDEGVAEVSDSEDSSEDHLPSPANRDSGLQGSTEAFFRGLRRRKRKGSLVPIFGKFNMATLLPLSLFFLLRWHLSERRLGSMLVISETLSSIDDLGKPEAFNYAALEIIELSVFDFGRFGQTYLGAPLDEKRREYVGSLNEMNDRALKVSLHFVC